MNWSVTLWLLLVIVFLAVEASTVALVCLWFAGGALTALVISLLGGQIWLQLLGFLAVSAILLTALRPLVRKFIAPRVIATNVDAIPGSAALVTAAIDNLTAQGQVKLNGMEWTARSTAGDPIPAGTQVRVDRVEGVKVYVSPVTADKSLPV